MQRLAGTHFTYRCISLSNKGSSSWWLTEVERERVTTKKTDETVKLSDTILERCARQAPAIVGLQFECRLCGVCGTLLDIVGLVQLEGSVSTQSLASE